VVVSDDGQVLLVHRPRYDDWTLPKGKLDPGETYEAAALREVHEETGLRCGLGLELAGTEYRDSKDRPKVVRYWLMEVQGGEFEPNDEVDAVRWLAPDKAAERLTYDRDRDVLRAAFG
jgi:8-oxo-dGTP diphosphatase